MPRARAPAAARPSGRGPAPARTAEEAQHAVHRHRRPVARHGGAVRGLAPRHPAQLGGQHQEAVHVPHRAGTREVGQHKAVFCRQGERDEGVDAGAHHVV
eukprot:scaffold76191_cov63-Phaeocystis_antarctica.AAC.3